MCKRLGAGQAAAAVAAYSQLNRAQALQERWGDGRQAARAACSGYIHLQSSLCMQHQLCLPERTTGAPPYLAWSLSLTSTEMKSVTALVGSAELSAGGA